MANRPTFGAELRRRRLSVGMSLDDLARLVHYSKGHLSRVETGGKLPTPDLARQCDAALGAAGQLAGLVARQPSPKQRREPAIAYPSDASDTSNRTGNADVANDVSTSPARPPGLGTGSLTDDPTALNAFEALFAQLRQLGATVSASTIARTVTYQTRVLQDATNAPGPHRDRLLALAARYAEFAGWMLQECGAEAEALRWTDAAVSLATARGDLTMAAHALVRRASIALYRNDAAAVIALSTAASQAPTTPGWLRAQALQRQAQGYAIAGDYDATLRALDQAAALSSPSKRSTTQTGEATMWLGSTTVADVQAITTAWCLLDLGHPRVAAEILDHEVPRILPHARRSRARYGVRSALAHALNGEIDQACHVANTVLADAMAVQSATVGVDVSRLSRTLGRWRRTTSVRELLPGLAAVMGATSAAAGTGRAPSYAPDLP